MPDRIDLTFAEIAAVVDTDRPDGARIAELLHLGAVTAEVRRAGKASLLQRGLARTEADITIVPTALVAVMIFLRESSRVAMVEIESVVGTVGSSSVFSAHNDRLLTMSMGEGLYSFAWLKPEAPVADLLLRILAPVAKGSTARRVSVEVGGRRPTVFEAAGDDSGRFIGPDGAAITGASVLAGVSDVLAD